MSELLLKRFANKVWIGHSHFGPRHQILPFSPFLKGVKNCFGKRRCMSKITFEQEVLTLRKTTQWCCTSQTTAKPRDADVDHNVLRMQAYNPFTALRQASIPQDMAHSKVYSQVYAAPLCRRHAFSSIVASWRAPTFSAGLSKGEGELQHGRRAAGQKPHLKGAGS